MLNMATNPFTKVTDFKTDNIYYLSLDRYQIAKQWTSMWVTGENSFLCPAQSDRGRKNNRLQNWILHKGK